jgi:predicted amidohydrolase
MSGSAVNVLPNADFSLGVPGELPEGWLLFSPESHLAPKFQLAVEEGHVGLSITGNGNPNAMGWIFATFPVERGHTYRFSVRFQASEDVQPYDHLLFSIYMGREWKSFNQGIFEFRQRADGKFEGNNTFFIPGVGSVTGEVRIAYKLNANGKVRIENIVLEQVEALPERLVRVACVQGYSDNIPLWEKVIARAAELGAELMLLPETFTGDKVEKVQQPMDGECASLMERMASKHRMYITGSFILRDESDGHLYNTALLFDRAGNKVGRYDKFHLFSPELLEQGISLGIEVPVFETDFGIVGIMICYDFWFTDVAELLALKGAEIILFPNAGYYRSLMPARANDNGVRVMASSMYGTAGVWDTSGADVERPDLDPTRESLNDRTFKDVVREKIDNFEILLVTLDLNESPSAHNWGGPMMSAPGGRRNRREQKRMLYEDILAELNKRSIE